MASDFHIHFSFLFRLNVSLIHSRAGATMPRVSNVREQYFYTKGKSKLTKAVSNASAVHSDINKGKRKAGGGGEFNISGGDASRVCWSQSRFVEERVYIEVLELV